MKKLTDLEREYLAARLAGNLEEMGRIHDRQMNVREGLLALVHDEALVKACFRAAKAVVESETPDEAFIPVSAGIHRVA